MIEILVDVIYPRVVFWSGLLVTWAFIAFLGFLTLAGVIAIIEGIAGPFRAWWWQGKAIEEHKLRHKLRQGESK